MGKGGGGSSTTQTSNIPEYARPYVMNMLGAAQNELFNTGTDAEGNTIITGMKGYKPFSTNAQDYFAAPTALQGQVYGEAAGMKTPGQFGQATGYANQAAQGGLDSVNQAYGYGQEGFQSGRLGQGLGIQGGQYYGGMGAGYGQQGADIGLMGLRAEQTGNLIGQQAQDYARQAAMAGQNYAAQATNPAATQAYMSPYMQNVVDTQKAAAVRDYQMAMPQLTAQAAKAGAFGGSRDAIARSEAARNLTSQLQNIQAQGQQQAFQNAQAQQQFGANLGLQGLAGAQQGLGTALQGGQLGLSGIGTALQGMQTGIQGAGMGLQGVDRQLAGTAQGMQGAQVGLQGVQGAQAGYGLANQAASNLANIGTQQQQADLSRLGFQNQLGQQQQAYQQQLINQQIQDYATQQQYPMMQLANMSNLLRGLPMQSTTSQTYMPGPNVYSQLAGLGTAAYGLGRSGFFKEGGEVKGKLGYITGGQIATMTTDELEEAIKNPKLTPLEVSMIQKAIALRERMEGNPETGNMMQRAGIGAIGTGNLVPEEVPAGAGGGIVAFATGNQVKLPEDYEERRKRLSEKEQEMWDLLKDKGYFAKSEEAQNQMKQDIENARQRAPNDAIILGGLAAAAGNPDPYLRQNFFSNIAYGGMQGLGEYNRGLAQIAADKKQLLQQATELEKSKYGRDVALANAIGSQIGQLDTRQANLLNARNAAAATAADKDKLLFQKATQAFEKAVNKEKETLIKDKSKTFDYTRNPNKLEADAQANVIERMKKFDPDALKALRFNPEVFGNAPAAPAATKTYTVPSSAAISALKSRKDQDVAIKQFDEIFGPGAAQKALGK